MEEIINRRKRARKTIFSLHALLWAL